jgi:hypothetical protein
MSDFFIEKAKRELVEKELEGKLKETCRPGQIQQTAPQCGAVWAKDRSEYYKEIFSTLASNEAY